MKQLYVKATGTPYGPPPAADKKKSKAGGGGDGQPKQMDTRKADKARKVGVLLLLVLLPKLQLSGFSTIHLAPLFPFLRYYAAVLRFPVR